MIYYDAYMQSLNIYDPDEESSFVAYCPSFDVADIKTFDLDLDGVDEVFVATKCFKMNYKGKCPTSAASTPYMYTMIPGVDHYISSQVLLPGHAPLTFSS
ncbi:MAG: hypothetical protein J7L98_02355 [Candidatus Verstraetearchaeota archaeon]|nr:hypothetical protein [Candidatus Verstraetearchaeota archaeon]